MPLTQAIRHIIKFYRYDGGMWIRVFGFGISITNTEKHPPLFSERNGYTKVLRIGKWSVKYLPPML